MTVESAAAADLAAVMNVFDGADLDVSARAVERGIAADRVLVARSGTGTVLGSLFIGATAPARIAAVAVRQRRRGQGIGTALLCEATTRWSPLVASFDPDLAPFYREAGFAVSCGGRCHGRVE